MTRESGSLVPNGFVIGPAGHSDALTEVAIEGAQRVADARNEHQLVVDEQGTIVAEVAPRPRGRAASVALGLGEDRFQDIFKRRDGSTGFIGNKQLPS